MKSGGGPARFSIMSSFFGGSDWFAFVVVVVLILLTFKIDLKKRNSRGYKCFGFGGEASQLYLHVNSALKPPFLKCKGSFLDLRSQTEVFTIIK